MVESRNGAVAEVPQASPVSVPRFRCEVLCGAVGGRIENQSSGSSSYVAMPNSFANKESLTECVAFDKPWPMTNKSGNSVNSSLPTLPALE